MEKIFVTLWILFGIYILVMAMVLADLWSGVRKAKRLGEARTSYGYRRTIAKIAQYYNVLIALSIVDAMQMVAFWYLEVYYQHKIPMFPFITLIGAILLCFIEIKSIYEKAEDKVRLDNAGQLVGKIITNKDDLKQIINEVSQYLKNSPSLQEHK